MPRTIDLPRSDFMTRNSSVVESAMLAESQCLKACVVWVADTSASASYIHSPLSHLKFVDK